MLFMEKLRKSGVFKADSGTAVVEFALTLPLLILLVLGTVDLGRYVAFSVLVGNAARAGAQVGAANATDPQAPPNPNYANSSVDTLASQAACNDSGFTCAASGTTPTNNQLSATTTVYCTQSDGTTVTPCPGPDKFVRVAVQGTFTPLIAYPSLPSNVQISSTAILQVNP
jgi:Flp pilus assembly protein TadG